MGALALPSPLPRRLLLSLLFPCSAQAACKDEELEALRAQLAKSAVAMEEVGTLRADVVELRRAAESEQEAVKRAASEARQDADAAKQLRCARACGSRDYFV